MDAESWKLLDESCRDATINSICDTAGISYTAIQREHRLQGRTRISEWTKLTFDSVHDKKEFKRVINEANKPQWEQNDRGKYYKTKTRGLQAEHVWFKINHDSNPSNLVQMKKKSRLLTNFATLLLFAWGYCYYISG